MIRVMILSFLGVFMVHMSDGSECTDVWLSKHKAISASPKESTAKVQEMCQVFTDYKSCLNRGPAEYRHLMELTAFKTIDQTCIDFRCTSNCLNKIKNVTISTPIKQACSAYYNFKSCYLACPNGQEDWRLLAASKNRKIIEYYCTDGNRRRYRRELSTQFHEAVFGLGNGPPDHQMNIFDDITQMQALLR